MKQVINGKTYNTETATLIETRFDKAKPQGDLDFCRETLYQKKDGEYFILGEGGPMTFYAESDGLHNIGWGARIYPLTEQQAKTFMNSPDKSFCGLFLVY